MMKRFYVYKYTCKQTGKVYIGQTCRKTPAIRAGINGERYKSSRKFYLAIKKYGWDNFELEILEKDLTLEEADLKEKEYIKLYDSIDNGYNIFDGGHNKTTSSETKELQRQSQLNKTKENRLLYGTGLKLSAIEKLSNMYKGKKSFYLKENGAAANAKSVYVYDKDYNFVIEYTSRLKAKNELHIGDLKLFEYLDSDKLFNNFYLRNSKI